MAYFDNAATTFPKPDSVYSFMNAFYRQNGANAGRGNYHIARSSGELIENTRKRIQELLHCPAKQVVFEPSATISLNIIIQGIIASGAKNVYISPFEHNAVTRTLYHYEKAGRINTTILPVDRDLSYDMEKMRYMFDSIKPDLIIVSHASNVFGFISPIEDIFLLGKKYGSITVLDMAQTAGLVDLNVGLSIIDFAVFAGHKTLYGPTGISGFVMNPAINLPPVLFGGTGFESANQNMPEDLPQRFEMGTMNIMGIAGLKASLDFILELSVERLWREELENRSKLLDILGSYEFVKIVGSVPNCNYVGIVSCIIDGISSDSVGQVFSERNVAVRTGLQCAPLAHKYLGTYPSGTIRLSVGHFTSDEDYEELNSVLEFIGNNLG